MSGIVKVGAALGQVSIPVIAVALIASVGWRSAFFIQGVCAALALLLAAWLMGIKPATEPEATPAFNRPEDQEHDGVSITEAKKAPALWLLCAVQFFFFGSVITIPTHIVPHAIDSGLTSVQAASVLSVIAAFSMIGRLSIGTLVDTIGGKRAFNGCLLLLFMCLVSLLFLEKGKWLYVFAAFYGIAHGGLFTVISPLIAEYFGMRSHGAIFGIIVFTGTIGGSALPIVTGLIFDKLGSYQWAFIMLASMVLISLMLSLRLAPVAKKF